MSFNFCKLILFVFVAVGPFKIDGQRFHNFFKNPPTDLPVLFGPDIVSDQYGNRDMAISPTGNELLYTLQYKSGAYSTILYSKKIKEKWSTPEIASFSGTYNDLEPAFSPDGNRIYFVTNRPKDQSSASKDYDIWYVQKSMDHQWTDLHRLDEPVNSDKNEFYPSVSKTGSIYFTREMEGKDEDIVVCYLKNGQYQEAISLPDAINSKGAEFNAFTDPDEHFIIFTAYKRPGNIGLGDLYIAFKSETGIWGNAKNLGAKINSKGLTYCPFVTADHKQLFFSSARWVQPPFAEKQNLRSLKLKFESPLNGWDNIYWLDAATILSEK